MLKRTGFILTILLVSLPFYAQFSTPAGQLEQHVKYLASDSLLGRGFGTAQGQQAAKYIAEQYEEAGIEPLNGSYFHPFNYRTGTLNISGINVVGIVPGSDPDLRDEYIVLGAHYDHIGWRISKGDTVIYNGADDNASGTASIIEIGRNLFTQKEFLGRSIILVAFDGEETGLIGSNRFISDTLVPAHKIKLMFSLDMVGMYEAHKGLDLVGVKLLNDSETLTGELASRYNITIKKANSSIGQRTDTAPFGQAGIPAIHAYTGLESPYHKPQDEADKLDYEGMSLVTNYLSAAAQELSTTEEISDMAPPEDKPVASTGTKPFRMGLRVNLGSSHHSYSDEFYKGKSIFAAGAGLFASIRAASFLTIQPEVLYETKGSQHLDGNYRPHAVTTPLNLYITTPDNGSGPVRTYFIVGGYYSYHFGGRVGSTKIDFQDTYTSNEFGITYGFGVEVMRVQWGLYYQRGLSSILQDQSVPGITHRNIYFTLGYIF